MAARSSAVARRYRIKESVGMVSDTFTSRATYSTWLAMLG
jgi:hypothetical protein